MNTAGQYRKRVLKHSGLIGLLGYLLIGLFPQQAGALTMSSDYYTIDNPVINNNQDTQQETQSTSQQKQDATDGESPPDYAIKSQAAPVSLSVSQSIIDFGILSATNPVTRSLRLNVTAGFDGYQILASEDHPLLSASAATIPDTSCDNGSCSSLTPAPLSNTLTY